MIQTYRIIFSNTFFNLFSSKDSINSKNQRKVERKEKREGVLIIECT